MQLSTVAAEPDARSANESGRRSIVRWVRAGLTFAACFLVTIADVGAARAVDRLPCSAPKTIAEFDAPLRGLARAVERAKEIRIVALGSSSTEGTGASSKQMAYPARFDHEMDLRFPGKDFQVANLGKGGELANAMLIRLQRDVIPARPTLVLWQTGVNDAIQGVDIATFRQTLEAGIVAMKAAGIEVVLVDPQYYPRAATVAHYAEFVTVMHRVAHAHGVPVFRRYAIMQHLIASGQHSVDALLWKDKFHLNDVSYACLAELMAKAVAEQIRRREPADTIAQRPIVPAAAFDTESRAF